MGFPATERGRPAIVLPEQIEILAHMVSTRFNFSWPLQILDPKGVLKGRFSRLSETRRSLDGTQMRRHSGPLFFGDARCAFVTEVRYQSPIGSRN
jgi:hypothetical protein